MDFRLAKTADLEQVKLLYQEIVKHMQDHRMEIWDDVYPCSAFEEDIRQNRLYVLADKGVLVSAFALCDGNAGSEQVNWASNTGKALYIDRLGVHVDALRRGIGSLMLAKAKETAKGLGAAYLRLFVVDCNVPAIRLYQKNGFARAPGVYEERVDADLVLHEYGYEASLT